MTPRKQKRAGIGAIGTCAIRFLHPQTPLQKKYHANWRKKRLTGLRIQRREFQVIRPFSPPTWTYICVHDDFPDLELYAAVNNVCITEEGEVDEFFEEVDLRGAGNGLASAGMTTLEHGTP
eukprot:4130012-Ditylum_brightwellii.AAC.1